MTNFDFIKSEPKFDTFADVAVSAEKILPIDYAASVINCRRAMEFALKWMYSVDRSLVMPWDDKLVSLMSTDEFRDIVDADLLQRMHFIRKMGNNSRHGIPVKKKEAELAYSNLKEFAEYTDSKYCVGCASGMDALQIAFRVIGVGEGSTIIDVTVQGDTYKVLVTVI